MSQLPEIFDQQLNDVADPEEIRAAFNSIRGLLNNGIETDNIKDNAVTDSKIGNRVINDTVPNSTGEAAPLTTVLSQLGKQLKNITGKANWFTQPTYTIDQIEQIADAANSKADLAVTAANISNSKADNAVATAGDAVDTANTADGNATAALNKATQVEADYIAIKPEIEQAVLDAQAAAAAVAGKADVAYVDQVAANFAMGVVSDGSITDAKLSNAEGQIKDTVTNTKAALALHEADTIHHIGYAVASGTDAYIVSIPGIDALTEGLSVKIKFPNANTGAATLDLNSLGAKAIQKSNGSALSGGNIKAGQIVHLVYTGSVFQLLGEGGEYGTATAAEVLTGYTIGTEEGIANGALTLTGDAVAANVLSGKTFYNTDAKTRLTGTIPSKSAQTYTPGTTNQTIAAGQYLSGVQTIVGDADLVASNIVSGKNIFGVAGNAITGGAKIKSIQRGVGSYHSSASSWFATITSVNPANCIALINYWGDREGADYIFTTIEVTNATTVTFTKKSSSSVAYLYYAWQVIEFESGVTIQKGTHELGSYSGLLNVTVNAVDLNKSILFFSHRESAGTEDDNTNLHERFVRGYIEDSTTLNFKFASQTSLVDRFTVVWYLLSFN